MFKDMQMVILENRFEFGGICYERLLWEFGWKGFGV